MTNLQHIVDVLKQALPQGKAIGLHEPLFAGNEWKYVKECLDTGWVSSVGKFVDRFEHDLASYTGAKFAIAAVNGTAALHICYELAGVKAGDEVLVPTLTFVATINPIKYCGAIPHFIDTEEQTLGIDVAVLDDYLSEITQIKQGECFNKYTGRRIRALCVMHTLGHAVDLDAVDELCQKYNIVLIEDAAEALGSLYKKSHVGHRGVVGCLSFNGNKIITTGGGGAILTDHAELAKRAKHITTTAKLPHAWAFQHDEVAYNYRLPNINAALGCAQLELLPKFLAAKRQLAQHYQQVFSTIPEVRFVAEPDFCESNYWLNALVLNKASLLQRDQLLALLSQNGLMSRPLWDLQHTLAMFKDAPRMPLSFAESLYPRLVKIPSGVSLGLPLLESTTTIAG